MRMEKSVRMGRDMDDVCRTRDQFNYLLAAFFAGDFFFGLAFFAAAFLGFAAAFFLSAAGFFFGEAFFFGLALAGELGAAATPLVSASSFTGERGAFPATFFGLAFLAFGFAAFFPAVAFLTAFLAGLFALGPFAVFFGFAAFFTGLFFGEDLAGEAGEDADSDVAVTGRFAALAFAGAFFGDALLARAGLFAAFGFDTLPFFTVNGLRKKKQEVREGIRGQVRAEGEEMESGNWKHTGLCHTLTPRDSVVFTDFNSDSPFATASPAAVAPAAFATRAMFTTVDIEWMKKRPEV